MGTAGRRPAGPSSHFVASAPGKLILIGEHAVVYGQPALIAAVDRRLTVRLSPTESPGAVELDLPHLGVHRRETWQDLLAYAWDAAERWRAYAKAPNPRLFAAVRGDDPAHLVKVALGEAAAYFERLGSRDPRRLPGLRLTVDSELPIGSGMGSSAALAVSTLAAVLEFLGDEVGADELEALALEVERRQHGLPSGVDGATVLHGGAVWAERNHRGWLLKQPLHLSEPQRAALARFRVFDTGTPRESTGEVVAAVRERLDRDPGLHTVIEEIGGLARELRTELETEQPRLAELARRVRQVEKRLEALGVVPEPVRTLIRRIEQEGGAAKISGAGALTSAPGELGAGSLLVLHPEPEVLRSWPFLRGLTPLELRLGAEGLRVHAEP